MKKALVISILTVLMYNSVGFVVSFIVTRFEWQQQVRLHLANSVGKNDFKEFHFHKTHDLADEEEFDIEGQFYDVFERQETADSVFVKCFSDEKETQLVSTFYRDIQNYITQKTDFNHKSDVFFSFLIKDYIFDNKLKLEYHFIEPTISVGEWIHTSQHFSSPTIACITPPPQLV